MHFQRLRRLVLPIVSLVSVNVMAEIDTSLLAGMKARNVGPAATSGRITDIEAVISDPSTIYAATASGGVWKSTNSGLNWEPIFDDQPYASIGAIAINQDNPSILWVGTGEGNTRNSTSYGGGLYKSIDAGQSWQYMGLKGTERINRIALDPNNPDIIYVAALGTLWSENKERGVYKSEDGGKTWNNILYVDEKTGATDIKMDPKNPNKLFATMWQFRRWPYKFESGGPGSGLYVSMDGGKTWDQKTEDEGLPSGDLGRVTVAISASEPNIVYALAEAETSALLRSDDGGESWSKVNEHYNIANRPFYYSEIEVDPKDPNTLYNIYTFLDKSIDGGKSFQRLNKVNCCAAGNTIHIDNHSLWINPANTEHLILGNDGGIAVTQDQGDTWRFVQNLPVSQFYHIRVDDAHPYNIYGGLQDNGSWRGPAEIWQSGGIRSVHWQEIGFGDGFDAMPFPDDNSKGYAQSQGGFLNRYDLTTGEERLIMPQPPESGTELRFNWNAALAQDPFDNDTIYYGSQFVHVSKDRGETWHIISNDLTTNNKDWQKFKESGGITPDVTAAENYTTIVTIAPSPVEKGVIWVGTDDGRIHVTKDGGKSWKSIEKNIKRVPDNTWVPHIEPSPHDGSVAHVVFDNHRSGDMKTYVQRIEQYGRKFVDLSKNNLRGYALSIHQDHKDPNLVFLGTELGLYVTTNSGKSWFKWDQGVPTVSVMDMDIQQRENDLVLGTHGRSVYIIDDYSALRGLNEDTFNESFKLLSVTPGQQYVSMRAPSTRFWGDGAFEGDNETYGVVFTVMASGDHLAHPDPDKDKLRNIALRKKAKAEKDSKDGEKKEDKKDDKVRIEISDSNGQLVRTFVSKVKQGVNRIVWTMDSDGSKRMPGNEPAEDKDILPAGAEVVAGTYSVKMTLNGETIETTAQVMADPRYNVSKADMQARYDHLKKSEAQYSTIADVATQIEESEAVIASVKKLANEKITKDDIKDEEHPLKKLVAKAEELEKQLKEMNKNLRSLPNTRGIVDDSFRVTSKAGTASYYLYAANDKPSATALAYLDIAQKAVDESVAKINRFLQEDLESFKAEFNQSGLTLFDKIKSVN